MASYAEPAMVSNSKRKPGKIKNVVVDLLDDGTYTICGYDEHHMESRKESASGSKDMMAKVTGMMGKTVKDKMED